MFDLKKLESRLRGNAFDMGEIIESYKVAFEQMSDRIRELEDKVQDLQEELSEVRQGPAEEV